MFIIILLLLGLALVVFPLHFNARGSIDMYTNDGILKGYFFIFRIFKLHLKYSIDEYGNNFVYIVDKKNKVVGEVHLNFNTSDKQSIANVLIKPILGVINIQDLELETKIGRANDAFLTAISIASFRAVYCAFLAFIKSWQHLNTYEKFAPIYDKTIFEVSFLGVFTFNIADILFGVIVQLLERIKHSTKRQKLKTKNHKKIGHNPTQI